MKYINLLLVFLLTSCSGYNQLTIYRYVKPNSNKIEILPIYHYIKLPSNQEIKLHIYYSFNFFNGYCWQDIAFMAKPAKLYTLKLIIRKAKHQDNPFITQHDCDFSVIEDGLPVHLTYKFSDPQHEE